MEFKTKTKAERKQIADIFDDTRRSTSSLSTRLDVLDAAQQQNINLSDAITQYATETGKTNVLDTFNTVAKKNHEINTTANLFDKDRDAFVKKMAKLEGSGKRGTTTTQIWSKISLAKPICNTAGAYVKNPELIPIETAIHAEHQRQKAIREARQQIKKMPKQPQANRYADAVEKRHKNHSFFNNLLELATDNYKDAQENNKPFKVGEYIFKACESVDKDWNYYSKAWHNAHGPKITTDRWLERYKLDPKRLDGMEAVKIPVDGWRGDWMKLAVERHTPYKVKTVKAAIDGGEWGEEIPTHIKQVHIVIPDTNKIKLDIEKELADRMNTVAIPSQDATVSKTPKMRIR